MRRAREGEDVKRALKWTAINGAIAVAAWFGVHDGVTGAGNVLVFMVWLGLALSALSNTEAMQEHLAEKLAKRSMSRWIEVPYDCAMLGLLVWHGWWITSVAYILGCICTAGARSSAKERLAAAPA
jgi:hypothetical protein